MTTDDSLTPREREVLALMAAGKTNGDISRELAISFPTAKTHVSSVLAKFGAASREEAVQRWQSNTAAAGSKRNLFFAPLALVAGAAIIATVGVWLARALLFENGQPTRDTELVIPLAELDAGVPRHFELNGFGAFEPGSEYGAWVTKFDDSRVVAFFDRDPHSGCPVPWRADFDLRAVLGAGDPEPASGLTGAYRDPCGGWTYLKDTGAIQFGASPRGLDSFPVSIEGPNAVVDLARVQLGICQQPLAPPGCSSPGQPQFVPDPPPPLIPDWGRRR